MTRGRKKNLDLPLSRSLEQQRAFRARKAQYIASIEERCYRAEAENERLRREVANLRAVAVPNTTPEFLRATSDLMQNLSSASESLARFQELAQLQNPPTNAFSVITPPSSHGDNDTPMATSHPNSPAALPPASSSGSDNVAGDNINRTLLLPESEEDMRNPACCSGLFDCRGFLEDSDSDSPDPPDSRTRTSGLRSTSNCHSSPCNPESGKK